MMKHFILKHQTRTEEGLMGNNQVGQRESLRMVLKLHLITLYIKLRKRIVFIRDGEGC